MRNDAADEPRRLTVIVGPKLMSAVERASAASEQSISEWTRQALRRALEPSSLGTIRIDCKKGTLLAGKRRTQAHTPRGEAKKFYRFSWPDRAAVEKCR